MLRVVNNPLLFEKAKEQVYKDFSEKDLFIPNGDGRRFLSQCKIDPTIVKEAFSSFGINSFSSEPRFGNFIGNHYIDGAFVHKHTDNAPPGYQHVRCNFAIEMPTAGGNPLLDDEEIKIKVGDIWICFASLECHSTTPIKGGQRLILSCGGLVESELAHKIYNEIKQLI